MVWTTVEKLLPASFVHLVYAVDDRIKDQVRSARENDWLINMSFMIPLMALLPLNLEIGYKSCFFTLIYLRQAYRNHPANYIYLYFGGILLRFAYLLHLVGCIIRVFKIVIGMDHKGLGSLPTDIPVSLGFLMAVDYAFFFVEPSQSVYSRILRRFQNWSEPAVECLIYKIIGVTCIPILFIVCYGAMADAETVSMAWLVILGSVLIVVNLRGTPKYLFVKEKANVVYRSLAFTFTYVMLVKGALMDEFCGVTMIGKVFDGIILFILGKIANALEFQQAEKPSLQPISRRRSI